MKIAISTTGTLHIMPLQYPMQMASLLAKFIEICPDQYLGHRVIEESEIPADRTFRNAWIDDGGRIAVDMDKAVAIHQERLRILRRPQLEALDTEYMRADEAGDAARKTEIAALKQQLRDVTTDSAIFEAKTPEQLKQAIPAILIAEAV